MQFATTSSCSSFGKPLLVFQTIELQSLTSKLEKRCPFQKLPMWPLRHCHWPFQPPRTAELNIRMGSHQALQLRRVTDWSSSTPKLRQARWLLLGQTCSFWKWIQINHSNASKHFPTTEAWCIKCKCTTAKYRSFPKPVKKNPHLPAELPALTSISNQWEHQWFSDCSLINSSSQGLVNSGQPQHQQCPTHLSDWMMCFIPRSTSQRFNSSWNPCKTVI